MMAKELKELLKNVDDDVQITVTDGGAGWELIADDKFDGELRMGRKY